MSSLFGLHHIRFIIIFESCWLFRSVYLFVLEFSFVILFLNLLGMRLRRNDRHFLFVCWHVLCRVRKGEWGAPAGWKMKVRICMWDTQSSRAATVVFRLNDMSRHEKWAPRDGIIVYCIIDDDEDWVFYVVVWAVDRGIGLWCWFNRVLKFFLNVNVFQCVTVSFL